MSFTCQIAAEGPASKIEKGGQEAAERTRTARCYGDDRGKWLRKGSSKPLDAVHRSTKVKNETSLGIGHTTILQILARTALGEQAKLESFENRLKKKKKYSL